VVVGIFFVPDEISRLKTRPSVRADFSRVSSDGRAVITIAGVKASKDWNHQLLLHDLSHNPPGVWSLLPDRNPICAALDSVNHRLFVGDASGALLVTSQQRSADGSSRVLGHGLQGWCQSIACSPDGKLLVAHDMVAVYAWDVDVRHPRSLPLWCRVDPSISCFAITPDSRSVIFSKNSNHGSNLLELDVRTGETRTKLASLDQTVERLVMSADGKFMACLGIAGEMTLFQWHSTGQSWKPRMISGLCSGKSRIATFSKNEELLITTDQTNHRLVAWDLERGVVLRSYDKQSSELLGCEFFDSDKLLSWSSDGKLQIWNLRDAAPVRQIQL
jgi:WD40 repeat protein